MMTHLVSVSGYNVEEPSQEDYRDFVYAVEERVKTLVQREVGVVHKFADGLYYREILIPKGHALTGRIHKQNDLNIVYYGDISVMTEHGTFLRIQGHASFPGKAGCKQFGVAHEDTLWATVHHTHLTDLDEIEDELFEDEPHVFDFKTGKIKEDTPCLPL